MLNLQLFAEAKDFGSAVKGSRLFIFEKATTENQIPSNSEVLGVRTTGDKGGTTNKVDSTTIKDIVEKQVLGLQGANEVSYTFLLTEETIAKQQSFVNKSVWIYEEIEDTSQLTGDQVGMGILMKVKLSGLSFAGQSSGNLREFTQEGTMESDDYYIGTTSDGTTLTFTGANTGVAFTLAVES